MSTMISARIADEIAVQGADLLKKNGHTVTQLINAAYEFYLSTGTLPAPQASPSEGNRRELCPELLEELNAIFEASSREFNIPADISADKEALYAAMEEKYASFA